MHWITTFSKRLGRGPIITVALIGLAALSWWLTQEHITDKPAVEEQSAGKQPDFYIKGLALTTTDKDGQPTRTLSAQELRHFLHDSSTELVKAALTIHTDQGTPWQITAESGWVSADGDLILLNGPTRLTREEGPNNRPLSLETRNLRIQPREGYAETDEKVTVISNQDRMEAVGLQAWLKRPTRIKFLSQVKGRYVPR